KGIVHFSFSFIFLSTLTSHIFILLGISSFAVSGTIAGTEERRASKRIANKGRIFYTPFSTTPVPPPKKTPKARKTLFTSPSSSTSSTIATTDPPIPPEAERSLKDYGRPTIDGTTSCIQIPKRGTRNLHIPPHMINMIQANGNTFSGGFIDDPNAHVRNFIRLAHTVSNNDVDHNAVKLQLFCFTLKGQAEQWLYDHPANHFTTWDDLFRAFLEEYFFPSRTAALSSCKSFTMKIKSLMKANPLKMDDRHPEKEKFSIDAQYHVPTAPALVDIVRS
ncbi:hypothetical protein LINPERHAP2_LOCUS32880, partial [Linum perenne]